MKSRILQIEEIIKKVALRQSTDRQYFRIHVVINQISMMYQTIYDILEKIEVAISFAKINTLHNSIINPIELIKEIQNFKNQLVMDKLPLEANIENVLNFEKIIEIKSYSKHSIITFILEIPLVESEIYHYYQLYPLPIPINQKSEFYLNLPHKPYLALSDTKYSYMDQICTQLLPNEYLCKEAHTAYMNNDPPCAVQLISYRSNATTCQPFRIKLHEVQITKITDGKWIITVPDRLVVPVSCENSKNNMPLFGSYLVESPSECSLQIKSIVLRTYKTNRLNYKEVSLPVLNFTENANQQKEIIFNPPTLDLDVVNLKETKEIATMLEEQKKRINEMTTPISIERISFWTILLYLLLIMIFIFAAYKLYKNNYFKKSSKAQENDNIII